MGLGAPPMTSRNCGPKACFARSEPHVVTNRFQKVYEQSPRFWSSVKKSSDPCSPPANGLGRRPNPTIRHRSITITNISEPACETYLPPWESSPKDRQSFFHLFQ